MAAGSEAETVLGDCQLEGFLQKGVPRGLIGTWKDSKRSFGGVLKMDSIEVALRKNLWSRAYRALRVRDKVSRLGGGALRR